MIYVKFSSPDVSLDLAAEYYFATERELGDDVFMLWCPRPTLVVGSFQNVHEEVDTAYAASRGIDIVRRLSGGGTVYQDSGSVQFAFIEKRDGEIDFSRYLTPICNSLRALGINAEQSGRNDITVDGKKVSGNSQYHALGRTVHHGTLLFSADIDEMERATTLPDYKISSKSVKSVRARVTNMCEYTDKVKTSGEFMEYLAKYIAGERVYEPNEVDLVRIGEIADEKFRTERQGNLSARSPKFDFEKICRFDGGSVIFSFKVKHGIIEEVAVRGDFFSDCEPGTLENALRGVPFTRKEVEKAIVLSEFSALGIDNESLATVLMKDI